MTVEAIAVHPDEQKRGRGRPPAITEEVARDLKRSVELGLSVHDACTVAGISERTYYSHCLRNPQFKQDMHRARRHKVLALAETAERAMQTAIAMGDWRAPLASLKFTLQRLDRERVVDEAVEVTDDIDPAKVAAVIRILRRIEQGDGHESRDGSAQSDGAVGGRCADPLDPGRADAPAGGLPGKS